MTVGELNDYSVRIERANNMKSVRSLHADLLNKMKTKKYRKNIVMGLVKDCREKENNFYSARKTFFR